MAQNLGLGRLDHKRSSILRKIALPFVSSSALPEPPSEFIWAIYRIVRGQLLTTSP
ncbi:hypothetical protein PIB30_030578 [Stylosanthes scabra]|uniref:Uncharacterized protein n=1 Tax=Stylosanthes scabra TaxID=79078 RepID=A0ABU6TBB8_9FABA|nr:hypothetical protein [Stylosanthes scabra]